MINDLSLCFDFDNFAAAFELFASSILLPLCTEYVVR